MDIELRDSEKGLNMDKFMQVAIEEAKKGLREGGIPIGSVLVKDGKIIGRGHNWRMYRRYPAL